MTRRHAFVVATAVLLALGGEALLHRAPGLAPTQLRIKIQQVQSRQSHVSDPEIGSRHAADCRYIQHTPDFAYRVESDSLGFPNRGPWPARADVVVLGNSLITGRGVGYDNQFTSLLARRFGGLTVVNLGLAGAAPEQQLRIYRRYARGLRPRLVIASLWVASDIDNALHFQRWLVEGNGRNFDTFRRSFGTTHRGNAALNRVRDFLSHSYLLSAAFYAWAGLRHRAGFTDRVNFPTGETVFLSARQSRRLAVGMDRPEDPDLRADFVGPLQRLRSETEARGSRFLVVLIPSKEEAYGAPRSPEVLRTLDQVREELAAAGLPVLNLYDLIRRNSRKAPAFFPTDIHLNRFGNALVARALGDWIAAQTDVVNSYRDVAPEPAR